jgi:hypothetical protein
MHRLVVAAAIVGGLFAGCGGGPPIATAGDAARANIALADLQQGRTLLLGKCGGCHVAPLPTARKINQWPAELDDMGGRAKLDSTQRQLIEQYLITMAGPSTP